LAKQTPAPKKSNNFQRIRELSYKQQGILALTLIERMKPNYELFAEVVEFPQEFNLDNMMDSLWQRLLVKGTKVSLSAMEEKVEALTPDEADFDMYGVYPAIYFCTSLLTYISGEMTEAEYDPVAIAKISQGAIVHLIEYQADGEINNEALREHELMQAEMALLGELLDWLETTPLKKLSQKEVKEAALELAFAEGVTNIGIAVE